MTNNPGVVWVSKRTPYRRASVVQKKVVVQGVYGHLEMEEVRRRCSRRSFVHSLIIHTYIQSFIYSFI